MILFFPSSILAFSPYDKNTWKQPDTLGKVKFVFNFDSRSSLLHESPVSFFGIKTGIQVARRWRTGIGFYFTKRPVEVSHRQSDKFPNYILTERSGFYYGTVFGEYIVFKRVRWEISLPLHLGFGSGFTEFYDQLSGKKLGRNKRFILLVEFSPVVSFRFCRWMGMGTGLGFRSIFNDNPDLQRAYNAPIVILRARFYLNELFMVMKTALERKREREKRQ